MEVAIGAPGGPYGSSPPVRGLRPATRQPPRLAFRATLSQLAEQNRAAEQPCLQILLLLSLGSKRRAEKAAISTRRAMWPAGAGTKLPCARDSALRRAAFCGNLTALPSHLVPAGRSVRVFISANPEGE